MAHIRAKGDEEGLGVVDEIASEMGIGPKVVVSHVNYTITEFVRGRTLEEGDVHRGEESRGLAKKLGRIVGELHRVEGKGNRLLRSLEIMADGVGRERGDMWRGEVRSWGELGGTGGGGEVKAGDERTHNSILPFSEPY